ncbi:hypothetical protein CLOSCI_03422 [[Clostridium] scindens ATCC 35704]|uniref:hypothetical protein n=1 Tax=Clostridium scindens (strain JCM 10418 / VPI 12708) TaxID=29347 RepID=UPI00016577DC|nr:hypothetical protein CLOSCI_03422 [[Clostridium] scindens ATCC 35704]
MDIENFLLIGFAPGGTTFSIGMMVGASDLLPLTQGIKLIKAISLGLPIDSVWLPIMVMLTFLLICGGVSITGNVLSAAFYCPFLQSATLCKT